MTGVLIRKKKGHRPQKGEYSVTTEDGGLHCCDVAANEGVAIIIGKH